MVGGNHQRKQVHHFSLGAAQCEGFPPPNLYAAPVRHMIESGFGHLEAQVFVNKSGSVGNVQKHPIKLEERTHRSSRQRCYRNVEMVQYSTEQIVYYLCIDDTRTTRAQTYSHS